MRSSISRQHVEKGDATDDPGVPISRFFSLIRGEEVGRAITCCKKGEKMALTLDEVILELYRLAETRKWQKESTDEALVAAIEGLEQIWTLRQEDRRRNAMNSGRKQPRVWS